MVSPILAALSESKVVGHSCSKPFGLVPVKCSFSSFHISPLDAYAAESFFAESVNGQSRLKRDISTTLKYRVNLLLQGPAGTIL